MKLNCMVEIYDYRSNVRVANRKQSVLHLGIIPGSKPQRYMLVIVSSQYPRGRPYKVDYTRQLLRKNLYFPFSDIIDKVTTNVKELHSKFIKEGKASITFKNPHHHIYIQQAVDLELKNFINVVNDNRFQVNLGNLHFINEYQIQKPSNLYSQAIHWQDCSISPINPKLESTLTELTVTVSRDGVLDSRILQLKLLKKLDLGDNCFEELPYKLGKLHLSVLNLRNNKLERSTFLWLEQPEIRQSLISINLSSNRLQNIPHALVDFANLQEINVADNMIGRVPFKIGLMKSLRKLNLEKNRMRTVPMSFKHMELESLSLSSGVCYSNILSYARSTKLIKQRPEEPPHLRAFVLAKLGDILSSSQLTYKDCPLELLREIRLLCKCTCGKTIIPEHKNATVVPLHLEKARMVTIEPILEPVTLANTSSTIAGSLNQCHRCNVTLNPL